jgi:hypothetical protein
MFELLFKGQEALFILISAMIIGGIFKSNNVFTPLFTAIMRLTKSKRLSLLLVSVFSGILPVEGRTTISAPILDSLVHKPKREGVDKPCCTLGFNAVHVLEDVRNKDSRAKMGILDYISTHHYYLWSPIEKSVIIIMAGLGLTYLEFMTYTIIPLLVYIAFLIMFVFTYIKDSDLGTLVHKLPVKYTKLDLCGSLPFLTGIVVSFFYSPAIVFPIVAAVYAFVYRPSLKLVRDSINWKTIAIVAGVILMANVIRSMDFNIEQVYRQLEVSDVLDKSMLTTALIMAAGAFAFMLGSSSKYAGITVAVVLILGMYALPIVLMVEYAAYLLSPAHKCLAISASYFKTKISTFYIFIGSLASLMILAGVVTTILYV